MNCIRLILTLIVLAIAPTVKADTSLFKNERQQSFRVVKVLTANTFVSENGQRMRLIGLKAPDLPAKIYLERDEKGNIIEPTTDEINISVEEQALVFARNLLHDQTVTIEYDQQLMDDQGYRLVYAFLPDGLMANEEILRMGFSQFSISPPNVKYQDRLRKAYIDAKSEKRGLMGE